MQLEQVDKAARRFVYRCGGGYSCLGFDYLDEQGRAIAAWLGATWAERRGTKKAYRRYGDMVEQARKRWERTGARCPVSLCPQLRGLEGVRVEVVDCYGDRRRFIVGRSTGFIPCHLALCRRNALSGPAVSGQPFRSVKALERVHTGRDL